MMKEVIQKSISGELHLIVPEGHQSQLTLKQVFDQHITSADDSLIFPVIELN